MSIRQPLSFVHRRNRDGSYDSICSQCAVTAASATVEADLHDGEINHTCDQYLLETRRRYMTSTPGGPKPPVATDA